MTLKNLITLMPDGVVSKHLFDPMLAGFADSNAKLREETLKSLVFGLDKLEEIQIRDKLLRSISTLQNDQEASLRTNATIFLGKLSGRVTEEVRHRSIYPGFGKAMKDPFVHCRIAGLKSVLSCMDLIDRKFLATKLLPQVCGLVVDPNAAVRELAMNVLTESMSGMQELHLEMKREAAVKEAERERLGVAEKERNHALIKRAALSGQVWADKSELFHKTDERAVADEIAATKEKARAAAVTMASISSSRVSV